MTEATRAAASPTRLLLVRHGEAVCNVRNTWAGHGTCQGLTPHGRAQAEALLRRLRAGGEAPADAVLVASAMRRAVETAHVISPFFVSSSFAVDCGLCEQHPGELDGAARDVVTARAGSGGLFWAPPGGESGLQLVHRVRRALLGIAHAHRGRVVVAVTHAGVIAASFAVLGCAADGRPAGDPPHASITEWVSPGGDEADLPWVPARYGDARHLA